MDRLLTTEQLAAAVSTPVATIRYWRMTGEGPAGFRVGRRVMYRETEVAAWLDQCAKADQAHSRSARHAS